MSKYSYYFNSVIKMLAGIRPLSTVAAVFLGLGRPGERTITLPGHGLRFIVRGRMDIWSVKETFLDGFYERFGAPIGENWTIIDIGGGIGDFTTLAASRRPDNRVFAFEPTPHSYELLRQNLALNGIHNAQAFQEAVWSEHGLLHMDTSAGEPGQFISQAGQAQAKGGSIAVPSIRLQDAFERLNLARCDLLKMDCEGAEYPILFTASAETLAKIDRLVMEYHDNVCEYTHHDLEKYLTERGFTVKVRANYVHEYLGYLYAYRATGD